MSPTGPQTRIADSDRERAMSDLAGHYAEGRLDHEEYDERLDAIWTARTRADLAVIFNDLPRPPVSYPSPAPPARLAGRTGGRGRRFPLVPVIALLVVLSVIANAPFWLLIFPLMFVRCSRRGTGCAPSHGHGYGYGSGQGDYRRTGRSHGV